MKETNSTSYYSVDNRLYQVVDDGKDIKGFAVDEKGEYHQVGLARIYAEGTPMDASEFKSIVEERAATRPIGKPKLRVVPTNG